MKKVCVVIGSRANYSSIKSAMRAIQQHPELELQVVATASAILDRYGSVVDLIEADGFHINERLYMLVEGGNPITMAKSTGMGLIELPAVFERLKPDYVVTVGDRFETMATVLAAAYTNICLVHTMGGEVTGTIDESIRHAVTKFSHVHFPASQLAKQRILAMGENAAHVHCVGCPRIDLVAELVADDTLSAAQEQELLSSGVGAKLDLNQPFLLLSQHPVTTEFGCGEQQILQSLEAIYKVGMPTIVLWPNADAGSEDISRGMRKWRERGLDKQMHFFKNLPTSTYIKLMNKTACLIGNSSSGIREGAFIGTPVVNIGTRQDGRERGKNVIDTDYNADEIAKAIQTQITRKKYASDHTYGDGYAGKRIADILARSSNISLQKRFELNAWEKSLV